MLLVGDRGSQKEKEEEEGGRGVKPVHAREGVGRASGSSVAGTFLGIISHAANDEGQHLEGLQMLA